MAHSVESPAVDVFPLSPPFLTNSTVVPLSASSRNLVLSGVCVCRADRGVREGENIRGSATDEASGACRFNPLRRHSLRRIHLNLFEIEIDYMAFCFLTRGLITLYRVKQK
jgi:hypothetical protein